MALASDELHALDRGAEGLEALGCEVAVGFDFTSVSGAECEPLGWLLASSRQNILRGHPCW